MDKADLQKQKDIDTFIRMQESPIYFIELARGLTPQPVKAEYKEFIDGILACSKLEYKKRVKEVKVEHFDTFVKGQHISWQQRLSLVGIEKGWEMISVASGHGTGKSAEMAWILIRYLGTHKLSKAGCTAPTETQMKTVLWSAVREWLDKMPDELKLQYEWSDGFLRMKDDPNVRFAKAATARIEKPEALAGLHAPGGVLIEVDEASGVADIIFTKMEGAQTSESILTILISNPTRTMGYFYDTHHKDNEARLCLQFSSLDSPVVDPKFEPRIRTKYGVDSDEYRYMVLGEFPKEDMVDASGYTQLIYESDIKERVLDVELDKLFLGRKKLGVDPAGEGVDETKGVGRDAWTAMELFSEKVSTELSIAGKTSTTMVKFGFKGEDTYIDNFGVGANVPQKLAQAKLNVKGVNRGDPAWDEERFENKRAECFRRLAEWLKKGGQLVGGVDERREDLVMIRYRRNLRGKIQIMSKKDMKKLFGKSPDKADALALTFRDKDKNPYEEEDVPTLDFSHLV